MNDEEEEPSLKALILTGFLIGRSGCLKCRLWTHCGRCLCCKLEEWR